MLDVIGFGSLNLDEFWEVTPGFLQAHGLRPGEEYVRDFDWFAEVYPLLSIEGDFKAADPGGSAANMIAALFRMGFTTGFYGATGKNDVGHLRLEELGKPENLKIETPEVPAGRCLALIDTQDPGRDRALVVLPNANDLAGSDEMDLQYFADTHWVHLTSFVSRGPLSAQIKLVEALPEKVRISFDPGVIYSALGLDVLQPILCRADSLFITSEELKTLTDQPDVEQSAEDLLEIGARTVVVKLGAKGILAFQRGRSVFQSAVPPAVVNDRTGAGDVAAAGFLAGRLKSLPLEVCLELAAAAASKSIEGYGRSTYPDRDFLARFLAV